MAMSAQDIRESGLLELYVLGDLSVHDQAEVEAALQRYPELKKDLREIEQTFELYARNYSVEPPASVLDALLAQTRNTRPASPAPAQAPASRSNLRPITGVLGLAFLLAAIGALYLWQQNSELRTTAERIEAECETVRQQQRQQIALYQAAGAAGSRSLAFNATEKYPDTRLSFSTNDAEERNFIKVESLPELADDQSFQLWSLGSADAPVPLDVFQGDTLILPVEYVSNSAAYAITIEPRGGSQAPNLDNLIAVVEVAQQG